MSSDVVRSSLPSSSSATPRSRLDSLSRDELICFVKKQVENFKLSKAENAGLREEKIELTKTLKSLEEELHLLNGKEKKLIEDHESQCLELEKDNQILKERVAGLENQIIELSSRVQELEVINATLKNTREQNEELVSKLAFDEKACRLLEVERQNEELRGTVDELRSLLDDTNQQLSLIKEKRNVENVFSLEIADYEKSVEKLQKELKSSKETYEALNAELLNAREELETFHEEKIRTTTSMKKMKAAIVKLKSELDDKKNGISVAEKENESLKQEIIRINNEREQETFVLSGAIGSGEEKIRQLEENMSSLNRQSQSLRSVKETLQRQYEDLLQEYNSFKARALYVLEQKKNDVIQHTDEQVGSLEETIKTQKKNIEHLKLSQKLLQDELHAESERALALENKIQDTERLMNSTVDVLKKKLNEQKQQFESRLASEAKLNTDLISQIDANFAAHARERERLIRELNEEKEDAAHKIEELRRSVEEERKKALEVEHLKVLPNVAVPPQPKGQIASGFNYSYYQRPSAAAENPVNSNDESFHERSLEEVIYGDNASVYTEDTVEDWGQYKETVNWEDATKRAQKQLHNIRELLCESEAANARLMEQTKLLKGEIRRMERNGERTDHVANTEYLKNIILKFIAPEKVDSEREQLIPVLGTMLRLSDDELRLLNSVAQADTVSTDNKPTGWGSYLHRWSGLS